MNITNGNMHACLQAGTFRTHLKTTRQITNQTNDNHQTISGICNDDSSLTSLTRASQINNKCNQSDNADNLIFKRIGYRNGNLLFQLNITIHTPSTLYISLDFDSDKILPLPLLAGCCHDHNHCIQVTINVIVI